MFFKNLIITGGAGFIGNNFIRYILKKNIEFNKLFIIDKLSYASHKNNIKDLLDDKRIFFYKVDICAKSTLNKTMQEIIKIAGGTEKLAIIHFAAETHNDNSIDNPPPFVQTNILGTYNLIEIARHNHMRFHHISTDEVFGDLPLNALPKNQKFTDSSPYLPSSPYSATKASSDLLVRA
jgi:dTDP-glucose 4,6-dehydratase